ncbi:MAG: hypothetical protein OEW12_07400, partial [Deltaproteobacteria bacterium]|nr:hypothetical protein [Deltaproteobacteria bacterium]
MIGNPLIPSKDSAETAKQERAEHSVRLISNKPPQAIEGLEEFLAVFNTREVDAVITPFRHVIQRKVRRNMGGKFGQGLSHEVVENVEINPNEDLIALRRWMGAVRQDPANIMLLQIAKVKEEPLAAPLVFSEQIKAGRPILITGADSSARDQLLSAVDLKFSVTPDLVDQNHALKTMILGRSQRRKGFMASMRNLMELDFLPQGLLDKITQISTGADTAGMADPEIINLILLSDLVSRYQGVLGQYKEVLANQTLQVTQLKNLFEMITVDIPADKIIEAFRDMVDTERVELAAVTTKGTLFAHAYQYITGEESKKDRVNRKDVFFKRLFSLILRYRSQIDPKLWNRCYFLANADPVEKAIYQGTRPYHQLLTKSMERMEGLEETTPVDPILVEQTGRQLFGLIRLANQDPVKMREPAEFARQRLANRLLPLFSVAYFNTEDFVYHGQVKKGLPEKPEIFLQAFKKVKITLGELKRIAGNLGPLLFYNEMVSGEVRKATLTVISTHKKEMEQDLHKVFAQSAHEMLPYFTFHLDQKKLSPVERLGAAETLTRRLGLEVHPNPTTRSSIGLFTEATPPPGKLQNPPLVLARTYQWLLSRQIEEATRNLTARKLNYLVKTWENRFFEWVYHHVAHRQGLAVSRRQFVEVMRERGPLKNLDEKNLDPETWDDSLDPFFPMAQPVSETDGASPPPQGGALAPYPDFEAGYNRIHTRFRQLLNNYKTAAEENPAPLNPARQIWSMISKGICDMTGEAAALAFEESVFHNTLQNLVFAISSDNHAEFHPDTGGLALTLHLPVRWAPLQWVGDRFQFLDGDRMVVFLFSPLPAGEEETMDEPSRLFMEKLQEALDDPESGPQQALKALCFELASYQEQWIEYSRYLSVALLDNAVTEGVVKMSLPPPVLPKHLWYLPDASKLCMGKPVRASESISFTRVLRQPDLLGSVSKNPKVLSTTIDEFAVDSYNISKLRDDLVFIRDICGDVWDGLKTISYSVADGPLVERYTK